MTVCGVAWLTSLIWSQVSVGSNPTTQTNFAGIAQMVEQLICNHQVPSSILGAGTNLRPCSSVG